jgi:hypothetical protein
MSKKLRNLCLSVCLLVICPLLFSKTANAQVYGNGCFEGDTFIDLIYDYDEIEDFWTQYALCRGQDGSYYMVPLVSY